MASNMHKNRMGYCIMGFQQKAIIEILHQLRCRFSPFHLVFAFDKLVEDSAACNDIITRRIEIDINMLCLCNRIWDNKCV
jgi:hypothetical protein